VERPSDLSSEAFMVINFLISSFLVIFLESSSRFSNYSTLRDSMGVPEPRIIFSIVSCASKMVDISFDV